MTDGMHVLSASPQANVLATLLTQTLRCSVTSATGPADLVRAFASTTRFDVAVVDLSWSARDLEFRFDGFDVLQMMQDSARTTPVIFAALGLRIEQDFVDEIPAHPEVAGLIRKAGGPRLVIEAVQIGAAGRRLPPGRYPLGARTDGYALSGYFGSGRRGRTAGLLAGAVASGRTFDARSLQQATGIPLNTANKLTAYLAPLIRARSEVLEGSPVTAAVVYRWCGEHAHYLLSWCRRHGFAEVATRFVL
ncbi:MAG: response regulator [Jatrophihabitans sp.]|nr:MAG: response regulator [Jatrophihabitans sp.]